MNKNINVKVKGRFHLKEANLTIDNGITDWGMSRLAGHVQHKCFAVAENFYYLFLGRSQSPTANDDRHNYTLINPIYERSYNPTGTIEIFHDPTATTTQYEVLPTGDMVVRFKQGFKVYFREATAIGELGIGPAYYNVTGPDGSASAPIGYTGTWPRTEAVGNVGFTEERYSEINGRNIRVDRSTRTSHLDNADVAIFSRAIVPGPVARYGAGSNESVVYECEITVAKEAVGFLNNVSLNTSAITDLDPADQFPNNKSFIAQCPFFTLNGTRVPHATINGALRRLQFTGVPASSDDEYSAFGNRQPIPPVFESCASSTSVGSESRGFWMLDFFGTGGGTKAIGDYNTAVPTMSANPWNKLDTASNPIDFPCTAEMLYVKDVQNNIRSSVLMVSPSKYLRTADPTSSTWETKMTFQFASDDLIDPIQSFSLWRALNTNKQIKDEWRGFAGIYTMFETPWNPPNGRVVELNYTFTWQR